MLVNVLVKFGDIIYVKWLSKIYMLWLLNYPNNLVLYDSKVLLYWMLAFLTKLCFVFSKLQIWKWIKPVLNLIIFPLEVQLIKEENSSTRYPLKSCVCHKNFCGFSLWQKINLKNARSGMTASMLKRSKIALHYISSFRVT